MKTLKTYLPYLLAFILGAMLFHNIWKHKTDFSEKVKENQKSERKSDSLLKQNLYLQAEIIALKKSNDSLQSEFDELGESIIVIKKEGDEKINNVDRLTLNQLERYFADRYPEQGNAK